MPQLPKLLSHGVVRQMGLNTNPQRSVFSPRLHENLCFRSFDNWGIICAGARLGFAAHRLYHKKPKCKASMRNQTSVNAVSQPDRQRQTDYQSNQSANSAGKSPDNKQTNTHETSSWPLNPRHQQNRDISNRGRERERTKHDIQERETQREARALANTSTHQPDNQTDKQAQQKNG